MANDGIIIINNSISIILELLNLIEEVMWFMSKSMVWRRLLRGIYKQQDCSSSFMVME